MEAEGETRVVSIPLERAIEIGRILENVAGSLHRISSRMISGDADAHTLDKFMRDWLVEPRLLQARGEIWDAIEQVIGEELTDEIAESVAHFPDPPSEDIRILAEQLEKELEEDRKESEEWLKAQGFTRESNPHLFE
ncbi:hypothetical protein [Paractinoplanes ferrugineus]|nr:hypothetical protein [Actinoplanes ferrugineus]